MGPRRRGGAGAGTPGTGAYLLAVSAILLLALSLRIPTTALGPLLTTIGADTGHGETFLSLLTSVPLALTLVVAPFAPRLAARFGLGRVVACGLVGVVLGTLLRSVPGDAALLGGTAVLGCAIAVGTVLGPAAIAAEHPLRRGGLTGVFTMALSLGPALALGATVPMMRATGLDWRGTLALWSLCGVLALAAWAAHTRSAAASSGTERATSPRGPAPAVRDGRVWLLAIYLGLTSLTFYTTSAWLPTVFAHGGVDEGAAGGYAALLNVVALPFSFLAPVAARRGRPVLLATLSPLVAVGGLAVLLLGGSGPLPVALLMGVSQGLCLGVAYDQVIRYARSAEHAASVSAVTSTVGIAVAAVGPFAFGLGLEVSGSATVPTAALAVLVLLQAAVGTRTGRA